MAIKRRWLQSALAESRRPQPKMPWQARKMPAVMIAGAGNTMVRHAATA